MIVVRDITENMFGEQTGLFPRDYGIADAYKRTPAYNVKEHTRQIRVWKLVRGTNAPLHIQYVTVYCIFTV